MPKTICLTCGYEYAYSERQPALCPLCGGGWECYELLFSQLAQPNISEQIAAWLGQLPDPSVIELAALEDGLVVRLYTVPGTAEGAARAWASLTKQQTRWRKTDEKLLLDGDVFALRPTVRVPNLAWNEGDPFLALGGQLITDKARLRIWFLGQDRQLQARLRALASFTYSTEGGVDNRAPNPWGLRLGLLRAGLIAGIAAAGISGGLLGAGWIPVPGGILGIIGGAVVMLASFLGILDWMQWRSTPKDVLDARVNDVLLRSAFTLTAANPDRYTLLAGDNNWQKLEAEWPAVRAFAMPLPAKELAALFTPPQGGEISGIVRRSSRQDVPAPPPAQPLLDAPFKIGRAAATGEAVGIDPDGHGMATGGSRTGKSSFAYDMLVQLIQRGEDAPGIFLVDPHLGLADAFLTAVDSLPPPLREIGIRRLRVITPDQPEIVPLNLLAVPEFAWAGNAIVQLGRRIWEDYWGPRMQAALLGLFRLAHAWNMSISKNRMGLLHTVFAAFNANWRHAQMAKLEPVERMGVLALDALLGQFAGDHGRWDQGWVTEVVSPIISKAMAVELSPWLFAALHQDSFVDIERWIRERAWIVLRLPSGEMGREGARLTAGVVYNVFEAAFRRVTTSGAIPYYFVIDEAQEIGAGMRLEAMLSEGAKFGGRMFVLSQSLAMMRKVEGFEAVVQSLLANTSTQAFFSPDPEDADLIRAALNASVRYGSLTLDLPTLTCWLRARVSRQWQPPTLIEINPLAVADAERINRMIREVITAHPDDYVSPAGWQETAVRALEGLLQNPAQQEMLSLAFTGEKYAQTAAVVSADVQTSEQQADRRNLGF
ncbi:MAG: TraM recognition domain-containing protein [Anaerolineae bacterium]|nr:TraM recognition domain-containing protein [Anaerolineae bacterium]